MRRLHHFVLPTALLLGLGVASLPAAFAAPTGNPAYADPAKTDADFPFQGEYAGTLTHDGQQMPFGVQVVALGDGKFDVVAYPGGPLKQEATKGPLHLQNHSNPVRYRNIWVLPKS